MDSSSQHHPGTSRRRFLALAGTGAIATFLLRDGSSAAATLPQLQSFNGASVSDDGVQSFNTLPGVMAPEITINQAPTEPLAGLVITECHAGPPQQGPLIIGPDGQIVWFLPLSDQPIVGARAFNVRVQTYHGQPVLTWFEGSVVNGHGLGHYVICDTSYNQIATVVAQRGLQGDLHEFLLTPQGTALFTCYGLSRARILIGNRERSVPYWFGAVQEVDVATGELVMHWRSDHHIHLSESLVSPRSRQGPAWDYFHINAISIDPSDQNLVVSGRNTWACYKLDRKTGGVIWRLGGTNSDFPMGPETQFAFQHDVTMNEDGALTVFDNEGGPPQLGTQSKGLVLSVDERRRQVTLQTAYAHDPLVYSDALGSVQQLGGGQTFIGWGRSTYFTQYGPAGEVQFDGNLTAGISSYRAFLQPWTATPATPPALSVARSGADATVYASWNGATEVTQWGVLGGASAAALAPIGVAPVMGLETGITVPQAPAFLAVCAYDVNGQLLATSAISS